MTEEEVVASGGVVVHYNLTNGNLYKNDVFVNGLCSFYISCTSLFRLIDDNDGRRVFMFCKNLVNDVRVARWVDLCESKTSLNVNPFYQTGDVVLDVNWVVDHVDDPLVVNLQTLANNVRMLAVNCGEPYAAKFIFNGE